MLSDKSMEYPEMLGNITLENIATEKELMELFKTSSNFSCGKNKDCYRQK